VYKREWTNTLAPYQVCQLNTYCGYYKQPVGFLHKLNIRAFISAIMMDDYYWNKLNDEYSLFVPIKFNQELFEKTKERAIQIFTGIDTESVDLFDDCEFGWECAECKKAIREICGKEEYKCEKYKKTKKGLVKCSKKMYEYPHKISKEFKDDPTCKNCTKKHNYERWKYV
jgi:hypothetical protein